MKKLFTIDRSLSNSTRVKVVFFVMGIQRARRDKHLHSTNVLYTKLRRHLYSRHLKEHLQELFYFGFKILLISSFYTYNSVLAATMFLYFNNYLLNERKISN